MGSSREPAAVEFRRVVLAPGRELLRQGDPGTSAYIVDAGHLVVRIAQGADIIELVTLAPGSTVGHLGLLLDRPRSATVVALDDVEVREVPRQAFEDGLERGEAWAIRFLLSAARELAERLAAMDQRLAALLDEAAANERPPAARVAELAELRQRLFRDWSF